MLPVARWRKLKVNLGHAKSVGRTEDGRLPGEKAQSSTSVLAAAQDGHRFVIENATQCVKHRLPTHLLKLTLESSREHGSSSTAPDISFAYRQPR